MANVPLSDLNARPSTTNARTRQIVWLWLPVLAYMIGIFIASSMHDPPIPANVPDVSLHGAAYFGLTLLLIRALAKAQWARVAGATMLTAWVIAVLYGVTDEWHQAYVPTRHSSIGDLIADALGACAGVIVVGAWGIIRRL